MKFPTMEEMAKDVAEKALDEYIYESKTIRQWVEALKDYDNKQTTLQRIVERLDKKVNFVDAKIKQKILLGLQSESDQQFMNGVMYAIQIVKEEM